MKGNTSSTPETVTDPRQPEEITPAWVTKKLQEFGLVKTARVKDVVLEPLNCIAGYLSTMFRLRLDYDLQELMAPRSLVIKEETKVDWLLKLSEEFHAFENEIRFYKDIAGSCTIRVPRCYYAWCDDDSGEGLIVFEDLSSLTGGDQIAGISLDEALHTIRAISKLHAKWWNSPGLDNLGWLPDHEYMLFSKFDRDWPLFLKAWEGNLTAEAVRQGESVFGQGARIIEMAKQRVRSLVHADLRADNLRINKDTGEIVILDWQLLFRGLPAFDVARLLGGSINEDLSADQHRQAWTCWHESLQESGVSRYTLRDAEYDYKLAMLIALHIPVINHAIISMGGRSAQLSRVMKERFFKAAVTLHIASLLR